MSHVLRAGVVLALLVGMCVVDAAAQVRVTPAESRGGKPQGEPWNGVPEGFRKLRETLPDWKVPQTLGAWRRERPGVHATVLKCLGKLPPRPERIEARVTSREEHEGYVLERFEFHNGVDTVVPGYLMIPEDLEDPAPVVVGIPGHGGSKATICTDLDNPQCVGPELVRRGYVVASIDPYFHGDRIGKGPAGERENKGAQESTLFKLNLWLGRSLWGMMIRDQQCLVDYLQTRPEVDAKRIGITGMSMGCTLSWWTAAVDERISCVVGIAGFTRYTELIALGNTRLHGIYYYVPGLLAHFDTEAVFALIAPRPMLQLSGEEDGGLPLAGIEILERKLGSVYALYGKRQAFRSVVYAETGHEYLPEMRAEMLAWFDEHLPVRESQ